ncbi:phosphotransferase [Brevibacterium sp. UCMA 11754]|uniref:phosphotransferase n=1 Tax=Brevibacterium sp. UCMA 11754 TaxID=2749198 RepID=UPI001F4076E8|nr:phosphotransferase [Brevibacterium sp. UCMA 11754]MCF2571738.1 hypothetical protein [Brevibacterium sp. UCMA 11754]
MASRVIPDVVTIDGETWAVRRAWPASRNRIAIEAKRNSAIRAGFLSDGQSGIDGHVDTDGHVDMLEEGRDPKLPGLERLLAAAGNQLISHRPGKRAVIRLADGRFAKCVRPSRAAGIVAGQDRAEDFRNGFALPNVLSADGSTVVLSALPGVELHDPQRLGAHWSRAWTDALDAWALAAGETVTPMPVHSADSEVQVLEEWRDRAHEFLGPQRAEIDSLIADVRADLLDVGAASAGEKNAGEENAGERNWGPIHRDLHDKQIMWDPVAGPGLLDVDTACLGERELDLGNLRAHARWRTQQGIWTPDYAEVVIREISRVTSASGLDPRRVRTYERSALVRLACVYAFRPRWSGLTGALLDAAHE